MDCEESQPSNVETPASVPVPTPRTLDELLALKPEQLAGCDIARMNLLCAKGLPGAEEMDVDHYLEILNHWTDHVRSETNRRFYIFKYNRKRFRNSEAYYRVLMLGTVLRQDFKIAYDQKIPQQRRGLKQLKTPIDPCNQYIHGLLGPSRLGSCASIPVLHIAVGRRLGYPLRLVRVPSHLFARWDDGSERFNIEASNDVGLSSPKDEFYINESRKKGHWLINRDIDSGYFLGSLDTSGELGTFLHDRAVCLYSQGLRMAAFRTYALAACCNPNDSAAPNAAAWVLEQEMRQNAKIVAEPPDPRLYLSTADAACACNVAGHCYEIWWGKSEPRFAWGAYLEAARLAPDEPRYRRDVERFRQRIPAGIAALPAPPFYGYAFACEQQRIKSPFAPRSTIIGQGSTADSSIPLPVPPPSKSESQAEEFASKGIAAEIAGQFAEARDAFAFAAFHDPQNQAYHDSIHRNDAKEQGRAYRERHGTDPPPGWRALRLKTVTVRRPSDLAQTTNNTQGNHEDRKR